MLKTYSGQPVQQTNFDLFRLSKSKREVDVAPNTLRRFFKQGLRFYTRGKCVFVSRAELHSFITNGQN